MKDEIVSGEYKFRRNFHNIINQLCHCSKNMDRSCHYLPCLTYSNKRLTIQKNANLKELSNTRIPLLQSSSCLKPRGLIKNFSKNYLNDALFQLSFTFASGCQFYFIYFIFFLTTGIQYRCTLGVIPAVFPRKPQRYFFYYQRPFLALGNKGYFIFFHLILILTIFIVNSFLKELRDTD